MRKLLLTAIAALALTVCAGPSFAQSLPQKAGGMERANLFCPGMGNSSHKRQNLAVARGAGPNYYYLFRVVGGGVHALSGCMSRTDRDGVQIYNAPNNANVLRIDSGGRIFFTDGKDNFGPCTVSSGKSMTPSELTSVLSGCRAARKR